METKICRICGKEKPITDFGKNNQCKDGYNTRCKSCYNDYQRASYQMRKRTPNGGNLDLVNFTPRELIEELKARGYKGHLEYTKTIIL